MIDEINRTIGSQISFMAKKYPNKTMLSYVELDYERTWKEFDKECEEIARGLMALGLKKGSHIAIWATNLPCWLLAFFGSVKFGGVCVTINTGYKKYEVEYQLRQSDAECLILIDGYRGTDYIALINELLPELKSSKLATPKFKKFSKLQTVVYAGDNACPKGMLSWSHLRSLGRTFPQKILSCAKDSLRAHDVINIQYTSGTSGRPKGVMLSHHNILNNGLVTGDGMRLSENDKLCVPVPFFHCFGLVSALMSCITHGASIVPIVAIESENIIHALEKEKCTIIYGVPTTYIKLLQDKKLSKKSIKNIRAGIISGASCSEKTMLKIMEKLHLSELAVLFGQTETSPATTMTEWGEPSLKNRCTTIGKPLPGIECKVVDANTGEELSSGQIGEFCARGNNMAGYYNDAAATARAIDRDGWLHSGDLAIRYDSEHYKVVGRIKDMFIRGGENVYPKEVEEYLCGCPGVFDAQVVSVPSAKYGEEACAVVIKENNTKLSEKDIVDFSAGLAEFKIPTHVMFVDEFPMTPNGKIKKLNLKEQASRQQWQKTNIELPDGRPWQLYSCS